MLAWYWISTTSRYLLPPTLNTTRLLPQMLALAYWSLMGRFARDARFEIYRPWRGLGLGCRPLQESHRLHLEDYRHHCA